METDLKMWSLELLELRGKLSMRGVFEFIEEELRYKRTGYSGLTRAELWKKVLTEKPKLREDILDPAAFDSSQVQGHVSNRDLAKFIVHIYKTLSDHIHSNKSPKEYRNANETLEVVEGPLSKRQTRVLYCICQEFGFPARLKLKMQ